jgi:WD40 repeat protein
MASIVFLMIFSGNLLAQHTPDSDWQQVIPIAQFGYGGLLSVYWSPLTGQLAAASERGLQFYDANLTLQAERRFGNTPNQGAIFSPDMRYAALREAQGLIVRDTTTWLPILALSSSAEPTWSPDSHLLAIYGSSGLQIWDVTTATLKIELTQLVSDGAAAQWSPDGQVIAVAAGATIVMVNVNSGDIVRLHDFAQIIDFEWSRDGRWFIIAGLPDPLPLDQNPNDLVPYSLVKLDAITGEIVTTYTLSHRPFDTQIYTVGNPVSISPDSRYIAAPISYAASIKSNYWQPMGMAIFDLATGQRVSDADTPTVNLIFDVAYTSWSPDSTRFASSDGNTLRIFDVASGRQIADLPAYINTTGQTVWTDDGTGLIAAGGLWDVTGDFPQYVRAVDMPTPPQDRYVAPYKPICSLNERYQCPAFMVPDPLFFDYKRPPYDWKLLEWFADRNLAISYEIDIEYPDTPEYEDDEPPEERYIIWDIATGERLDKRVYLGLQTAWLYDLEDVDYIESESRAFNIRRNTRFIGIGDDELVDLREETVTPFEAINEWEWREVWFSPDGSLIYAYDTNGRFKAFDPLTGALRYETTPAPRHSLGYTTDLTLTLLQDEAGILYIYETTSGALRLETYTANYSPMMLWNADRSRLAIGGENRAIILFDVPTQERLGILRGHQNTITSMAWNPACDYDAMAACRYVFASSDANGQVILWGTERPDSVIQTMPEAPSAAIYAPPVADIQFAELTPLWSYITFNDAYGKAQAQTVRWTEAGIRINGDAYYTSQLSDMPDIPIGVVWLQPSDMAQDGRLLASNGAIYDAEGNLLAQAVSSHVLDATFDPAGERIITAENIGTDNSLSGWIREYSARSGQFIQYWGGGNPGFEHIAYSPNHQWIATTTLPYYDHGARVQIWFADRFNAQFSSLVGHSQRITALFWDGETVLTSSEDGTVRRWDIRTGLPLARWEHPTRAAIVQMAWRDTQTLLVSAGDDLTLLNADTLAVQQQFAGVGGGSFDWSPDKTSVTAIGSDAIVRVIDMGNGIVAAEETYHMPNITHLEWHPDGDSLAAARTDGSIALFEGTSGTLIRLLRPHGIAVRSMLWSPNGAHLLVEAADGSIQILDGKDGTLISAINNPWRRSGVWWSPDSNRIAFGTYPDPTQDPFNSTSLLNIHALDGTLLTSFDLRWADYSFYWEKKPFLLSWSTDAEHIAAFYQNGVRVWNTTSGDILSQHINALNLADPNIELYPQGRPPQDARIVLTQWEDNTLYFWRADSTWRLDIAADDLTQLANSGLPYGTQRRADGHVLLSQNLILHAASNYSLQSIASSYTAAAWHPHCWSQDCSAVLAVAHGSTITIFGYPNPTEAAQ